MEEKRVDMRKRTPEEAALYVRQNELLHQFNHTLGRTEESRACSSSKGSSESW